MVSISAAQRAVICALPVLVLLVRLRTASPFTVTASVSIVPKSTPSESTERERTTVPSATVLQAH